jgi:hypothetical protein
MAKNLVWRIVEHIYVGVHNTQPPSQTEWDAMLADLARDGAIKIALIHSEGGSPSALQRKQLRDVSREIGVLRGAVLTGSVVARAAITAINLFSKNFSTAFPPHEVDAALSHLEAPREHWPLLKKELAALKRELSILG